MEAATISTTEISNPDQCPSLHFISLMDHSLHRAAVQGNIDAFKQHGPLELLVTRNKNTILHIYITARSKDEQASLDFVKAILDMCPNLLWQINNKDETLLHIAARHGHDDIVNLLIEKSKETHFDDQENGLGDAKQLLKRMTKAKDTALHEAVRFKHIDVVKILIKENVCELHGINSGGETPFYLAVERGYKDIVEEMKHSAKAFQAYDGPNGRTALHAAVFRRDLGLTKLMLELQNNLTKKADKKGWNPFHYAADRCYRKIVREILKYDESVVYCVTNDENKMTALHLIARSTEMLKELISRYPCCAELVDNRNWNFLHFAVDKGNYEVFDLIIENPWLFDLVNECNSDGNTPLLHFFASERSGCQRRNFYECFAKFYIQSHQKVNMNAFNRQNRSFLDMMMSQTPLDEDEDEDEREHVAFIEKLRRRWMQSQPMVLDEFEDEDEAETTTKKVRRMWRLMRMQQELVKNEENRRGLRIVDEKSEVVDGQQKGLDKDMSEIKEEKDEERTVGGLEKTIRKIKEEREGYLVAAALIATVSFTAGLTVPGGYKNDVGTALLIKSAAFQVFSVTNTLAFICSSCAVMSHIFLVIGRESSNKYIFILKFSQELRLTVLAMIFMVVAFITGSYAVLASSLKLAISLCAIQCLSIGPFFLSKREVISSIGLAILAFPLEQVAFRTLSR